LEKSKTLGEGLLIASARSLIAARCLRSIAQGILLVDFTLYLRALGWTAVQLGALFTAGIFFQILLILLTGPLVDRLGPRPVLLSIGFLQGVVSLGPWVSQSNSVLWGAALFCGFGIGAGAASGPFSPVELAWLGRLVRPVERGKLYSFSNSAGFAGIGIGAFLGMFPERLAGPVHGPSLYQPVFPVFSAFLFASCILVAISPAPPPFQEEENSTLRRTREEENLLLGKLVLANALNGLGIGLFFPLLAWWFSTRFGRGPQSLGALFAMNYILIAVSSYMIARLSLLLGVVRSVLLTRGVGLVMLLILPFSPTFGVAFFIYVLRSIFNQGSVGSRQSLSLNLVGQKRHGLAGTVHIVSTQLPMAIGPYMTGALFHSGHMTWPFILAASLQGAYLFLYWTFFLRHDPNGLPAH
jgi:MFS family permease